MVARVDIDKPGAYGPISVMTFFFAVLTFWRFSPGIQVIFGQTEKTSEQSVQLDKTHILLSHLLILYKYNLSSG